MVRVKLYKDQWVHNVFSKSASLWLTAGCYAVIIVSCQSPSVYQWGVGGFGWMLTLSTSCSKASLNDASGQILRFVPSFVLSLGQGGLVGMNKLPPGGLLSCQRYQCVITAFYDVTEAVCTAERSELFSVLGEIHRRVINTGPFQITRWLIRSFTRLNCNCRVPMPTLIVAKWSSRTKSCVPQSSTSVSSVVGLEGDLNWMDVKWLESFALLQQPVGLWLSPLSAPENSLTNNVFHRALPQKALILGTAAKKLRRHQIPAAAVGGIPSQRTG